ncbi:MAG: histidine phosphatase family protein [Microbacterium sp.]|nr:histidine phosphatase family protein [Microbacterium sp.]
MTLLTLVRHGQTDWNLARRIQGTTDIPLNETGRADARWAAGRLGGVTHHSIYASPLVRARETAEIIAAELGLDAPSLVADMREREFGEGEGMLVPDYIRTYGDWHAEVPGAESLAEVGIRSMAALHRIAREARRRSAPVAESVIVVTHGGVIRSIVDHVSGGTLPREGEVLANGSMHRFEVSPGSIRLLEQAAVL